MYQLFWFSKVMLLWSKFHCRSDVHILGVFRKLMSEQASMHLLHTKARSKPHETTHTFFNTDDKVLVQPCWNWRLTPQHFRPGAGVWNASHSALFLFVAQIYVMLGIPLQMSEDKDSLYENTRCGSASQLEDENFNLLTLAKSLVTFHLKRMKEMLQQDKHTSWTETERDFSQGYAVIGWAITVLNW